MNLAYFTGGPLDGTMQRVAEIEPVIKTTATKPNVNSPYLVDTESAWYVLSTERFDGLANIWFLSYNYAP